MFITSGLLKKAGIQFKHTNVLRNEDEEFLTLKVFDSTPKDTVKSHPCLSIE